MGTHGFQTVNGADAGRDDFSVRPPAKNRPRRCAIKALREAVLRSHESVTKRPTTPGPAGDVNFF